MAEFKHKLFLFQWDEKSATARASELGANGWLVEMEIEEGSRGCTNLRAFGPDIVVFDIAKKAVHSRECGRALRNVKRFRETPFIFVDGTDEDVSKVKEKVPAAIFTTSGELLKILPKYRPFMHLAGILKNGPKDLSQRKGFNRPTDGLCADDQAGESVTKDRKKALIVKVRAK